MSFERTRPHRSAFERPFFWFETNRPPFEGHRDWFETKKCPLGGHPDWFETNPEALRGRIGVVASTSARLAGANRSGSPLLQARVVEMSHQPIPRDRCDLDSLDAACTLWLRPAMYGSGVPAAPSSRSTFYRDPLGVARDGSVVRVQGGGGSGERCSLDPLLIRLPHGP